jgi:hypothetical protein
MGNLVFVNINPTFQQAGALGISIKRDLIVLAFLGDECLSDVHIAAHKSEHAFKDCPYLAEFRDEILWYDQTFNSARLVSDASAAAQIVGFNPSELKLSGNDKFCPVADDALPGVVPESFLHVMAGSTDAGIKRRSQIVRYYQASDNGKDRPDVMQAISRAYAARSAQRNDERIRSLGLDGE